MDYAVLKAEIALPAYNGLNDTQTAAALNAVNVAVFVDLDPRDWLETLINSGEWGKIETCANLVFTGTLSALLANADLVNVGRLRTFVQACTSGVLLRTSRSAVRTVYSSLIDALVSASFISAGTATTLKAFASGTISRAAQLGLGTVQPGDVATARTY